MRLWASISTTRPRFPFATFVSYGPPQHDQISGAEKPERYSGPEDEKPHRGLRRQHPDPHADRAAPGDPQREGGRPVSADLDRVVRGPGDRNQDLGQPARPAADA